LPSRCAVKGELCSAAKRRTLDGADLSDGYHRKRSESQVSSRLPAINGNVVHARSPFRVLLLGREPGLEIVPVTDGKTTVNFHP
jgi:hypothetical protein